MDMQRALLDELMGVSRDGEREEKKLHFTDDEVCKFYIQGFCFYEEFQRTKHNYGDCDKKHDDRCKAAWEALPDEEKARYPYEAELWAWLEKLDGDVRAKIKRNQERVKKSDDVPIPAYDRTRINELDEQIKAAVQQADQIAEAGDVDGAAAAVAAVDKLKAERAFAEEEAVRKAQDAANRYGEQEVCEYSGVIVNREESRIRDHESGRNYRAWVRTHEKRKEMLETFARRGTGPPGPGSSYRGGREEAGRDHRERSRDRDRDRSRDRDRERRERGRDRERDRGYSSRERSRGDRDRDRERERERERDRYYRERERDRSRRY